MDYKRAWEALRKQQREIINHSIYGSPEEYAAIETAKQMDKIAEDIVPSINDVRGDVTCALYGFVNAWKSFDYMDADEVKWLDTIHADATKALAELDIIRKRIFNLDTNNLFGDQNGNGGFIGDLCFTVWNIAKAPNTEDDGPSDWGCDQHPTVRAGIERSRDLLKEMLGEARAIGAEADTRITNSLSRQQFIPHRSHYEGARNTIRRMVEAMDRTTLPETRPN